VRKIRLSTNNFYHIYNRGVDGRTIFPEDSYYRRFTLILEHSLKYNYPYSQLIFRLRTAGSTQIKREILAQLETKRMNPPVEIISFCLMPNHYHLALKQLVENGISDFLHRIGTSYTRYFNTRLSRSGRLFETSFKAVGVESDNQLLHLTRYQHLNPIVLGLHTAANLKSYPWSSFPNYMGKEGFSFVNPNPVVSLLGSAQVYTDFVTAKMNTPEPQYIEKVAIDNDLGWFVQKPSNQASLKS